MFIANMFVLLIGDYLMIINSIKKQPVGILFLQLFFFRNFPLDHETTHFTYGNLRNNIITNFEHIIITLKPE